MATNLKTGKTPKDTQIKPISQGKEPEHDLTVNPLQTSKLYQAESIALLESKSLQAQPSNGSSEVTKGRDEPAQERDEFAKEEKTQKEK